MVCALLNSFWQKNDEKNRVWKSAPQCPFKIGEGGSKAIWAMAIWKQHISKRGFPYSYLFSSLGPTTYKKRRCNPKRLHSLSKLLIFNLGQRRVVDYVLWRNRKEESPCFFFRIQKGWCRWSLEKSTEAKCWRWFSCIFPRLVWTPDSQVLGPGQDHWSCSLSWSWTSQFPPCY